MALCACVCMLLCVSAPLTVRTPSAGLFQQCKPHKRPVCGSNGKTYLNHCELHRDACLTGSKIQVDYDGHCKGRECSHHHIPVAAAGGQGAEQCGIGSGSPFHPDHSTQLWRPPRFLEVYPPGIHEPAWFIWDGPGLCPGFPASDPQGGFQLCLQLENG